MEQKGQLLDIWETESKEFGNQLDLGRERALWGLPGFELITDGFELKTFTDPEETQRSQFVRKYDDFSFIHTEYGV